MKASREKHSRVGRNISLSVLLLIIFSKEPNVVDDSFSTGLANESGKHQLSKLSSGTLKSMLDWYPKWLKMQFDTAPSLIRDHLQSLPESFEEIAIHATTVPATSLDDMASHLLRYEPLQYENDQDKRLAARSIAFAILGWQTMLYLPDLGACPMQQFAIADIMDGYNGQAFMKFKQDHSTVKHSLSEFLLGFGLMLPKENICVSEDAEGCQAFEKVDIVTPQELNAPILQQFAGIDIEWVDVLAPHLEFDKATNKLYMFRNPSFCRPICLHQEKTVSEA
jgi:hypothetical protein